MSEIQKEVIRRMSDDDRVSVPTLCHRLGKTVESVDLKGLRRRGLLENVNPRVWKLTQKGRLAAREARRELDRTYEIDLEPRPARASAEKRSPAPPKETRSFPVIED